jgi:glycosyltransferase involved in cell wall biosynthesis
MNEELLFTISIPTYNRAQYLDLCLGQICKQLLGHESLIELMVFDNHSTDTTPNVVRKYTDQGFKVRHIRHNVNIGGDRNFIQCFQQAHGKYVLLLGDDDVLLDCGLNKIIQVLNGGEYGIVFLKPYGFS